MSSYGHNISKIVDDAYSLRWWVNHFGTRRGVYARPFDRPTDEAGAKRFAKRWGVEMPEDRQE